MVAGLARAGLGKTSGISRNRLGIGALVSVASWVLESRTALRPGLCRCGPAAGCVGTRGAHGAEEMATP